MKGLDTDNNNVLEAASTDRILEHETGYIQENGYWWHETTEKIYATDNSATATTTNITRTRLTGLGTDGLVSEIITTDIHGNESVDRLYIDRVNKQKKRELISPDSTTAAQTITENGLLISSRSKSNVTTTFTNDGLGRRISATDPRTGTAVIHYDSSNRIDYREDGAGNRTTYGYNPTTGQRISESNTQGKSKRLSYNPTGQVTHIWGDTDYPLHYVYNAYGERIEQHTYRGGSNWNSTSWPASTTGPADISLFVYQESSGLLTAKEDASAKSTTYSYYPGGLLHTRTWSRLNGSEALVTTYQYDPATAELTDVDYSDTTPDIHYGYYRHGGYQSISDALGSRDFLYNDDLQLLSETISGLYNRSIGRSYDQSTVKGRATGLQTDFGYAVSYGYEGTTGRFNSVSWDISSQTGSAVYTYQADSDLLHSLTSGSRETTYSYESDRDLLKTVLNRNNAQTVSEYSYQFDAIGRRKSRSTATDTKYFGYNDRSEVTAESYTENPAQSGNETTYSSNALNQYAGITGTQTATLSYDNDGNLISHKGMQYTYNAENRLISIIPSNPANNDRMLEFAYDYMGRRIEKKVSTWHDTEYLPEYTSYFVYDKWNLIEEIRQGQSYYYIWGLDLSRSLHGAGGIGGLLATVRNASTYQYFYDGNGNVSDVVNTGGPDLLGADDNPFRFSTKYLDLESGLYYYGYRYYSPELGRWPSREIKGVRVKLNLHQ